MWRKVLSQIGRVAWTITSITAVTVLIWLYAEGENVRRYDVSMDVKLVSPGGRDLVIQPGRRPFQVAFTCAADQLTQFRQLLQAPFTLEVNEEPGQPNQILVMRDKLAADPRISKLGINIVDVQPATLPVHVESLVALTLPVHVKKPGPALSESVTIDPVTDPSKATVQLPASVARRAKSDTAFEVTLDPARLAGLAPNVVNRLAVQLSLPAVFRQMNGVTGGTSGSTSGSTSGGATIEPSTVNVSVTVRTLTAETTLAAVPIKLVISPGDMRNYDPLVLADDHVRNLILRGPRDVIKNIQDGKTRVYAELRLSAEDLEAASHNKDGGSTLPVINAPSGVSVSNLTNPIRYTVTRHQ